MKTGDSDQPLYVTQLPTKEPRTCKQASTGFLVNSTVQFDYHLCMLRELSHSLPAGLTVCM